MDSTRQKEAGIPSSSAGDVNQVKSTRKEIKTTEDDLLSNVKVRNQDTMELTSITDNSKQLHSDSATYHDTQINENSKGQQSQPIAFVQSSEDEKQSIGSEESYLDETYENSSVSESEISFRDYDESYSTDGSEDNENEPNLNTNKKEKNENIENNVEEKSVTSQASSEEITEISSEEDEESEEIEAEVASSMEDFFEHSEPGEEVEVEDDDDYSYEDDDDYLYEDDDDFEEEEKEDEKGEFKENEIGKEENDNDDESSDNAISLDDSKFKSILTSGSENSVKMNQKNISTKRRKKKKMNANDDKSNDELEASDDEKSGFSYNFAPRRRSSIDIVLPSYPDELDDDDDAGDGEDAKDDVNQIFQKDVKCYFCNDDVTNRAVLAGCRHIFCRECIVHWATNSKTECPTCEMEFTHVFLKTPKSRKDMLPFVRISIVDLIKQNQ